MNIYGFDYKEALKDDEVMEFIARMQISPIREFFFDLFRILSADPTYYSIKNRFLRKTVAYFYFFVYWIIIIKLLLNIF